jgi:hypothetical protein
MRALTLLIATCVLATAVPSFAQCPTNPAGGPTLIHFRGGNDGSLTDVDIGTTGLMHDIEAPGLRMTACLANCDGSTDPECTIETLRTNAQGQIGITTPTPLFVGGTHVCVNLKFPTPFPGTTGTANIQTGDVSFTTSIDASVYVGSAGAACPTCIETVPGMGGTCNGGGANGRPCAVERVMTVDGTVYPLSFECQPNGTPAATTNFPVSLTSGTATEDSCTGDDACAAAGAGTCNQTTCTPPLDGLRQNCCSGDPARSCFPADEVSRTGIPVPPIPAWPDPTYPKTEKSTYVSTSCVPALSPTYDTALGLPGPAALDWHVVTNWEAVDTTTTTSTSTTTLPGNCAPNCDDDNACTVDACVDLECVNTLEPSGIPGVRCLIDRMRTRPLCGEATVDAKLAAAIDKALGKADGALAKADVATGKKRAKQLKKAKKQLRRIFKKTDKAKAKDKITDECHVAITGRTGGIKTPLDTIQ